MITVPTVSSYRIICELISQEFTYLVTQVPPICLALSLHHSRRLFGGQGYNAMHSEHAIAFEFSAAISQNTAHSRREDRGEIIPMRILYVQYRRAAEKRIPRHRRFARGFHVWRESVSFARAYKMRSSSAHTATTAAPPETVSAQMYITYIADQRVFYAAYRALLRAITKPPAGTKRARKSHVRTYVSTTRVDKVRGPSAVYIRYGGVRFIVFGFSE